MERKFKIGDKVEVAAGHKGVIVDEIYNQITGRLFSVDCGENGFGQYKASALTLIEESPERKFKVGDRVKDYHSQKEGKIVYIDEGDATFPYLIVFYAQNGICNSTWCKESDLTLIEPEHKYQKGDKVWHKNHQKSYLFIEHQYEGNVELQELSSVIGSSESEIEPYYHQDLELYMQNVRDAKKENAANKPTHPYTVILKSGVKVGISATIFDYITEQDSYTKSVQTVADGTIVLSEIAAIVPIENLIP